MEEKVAVSKITMDDGKEYLVIDKIEEENVGYLFLSDINDANNIAIKKYFKNKNNNEVYKLKNMEELAHAYELYQKKHQYQKNSL